MLRNARNHPGYWAFLVHRVSGLLLTLYLPAHFYVLGLVLRGEAALDGFLHWTEAPLVKIAETVLVLLLASHLSAGLRLLAIEFLPWREGFNTVLALAGGIALALGLAFAFNLP